MCIYILEREQYYPDYISRLVIHELCIHDLYIIAIHSEKSLFRLVTLFKDKTFSVIISGGNFLVLYKLP